MSGGAAHLDKAVDKAPDAFRTISEVAEDLDLPQHVLRFWETRFIQIRPMKRGGGRRFYRREDVELLRGIRHLLYGEGYTIRGVQRILKDNGVKFVQSVWQAGAPQPSKQSVETDEQTNGAMADAEAPALAEAPARRGGLFGILPSFRSAEAVDDAPRQSVRAREDHPASREEDETRAPPPLQFREPPRVPLPPREPPREPPTPPSSYMEPEPPRPMPAAEPARSAAVTATAARAAPIVTTGNLSREDLRRLQATLYELTECRRLIEVAMDEKS